MTCAASSSRTPTAASRARPGSGCRSATVAYAEDQLLARDMLAAGYAKVYRPDAAVIHSHDYAPLELLRRSFDEWRGLREVGAIAGPPAPVHAGPRRCSGRCATTWRSRAGRGPGRSSFDRRRVAAPPLAARARARRLGSRADHLPAGVRAGLLARAPDGRPGRRPSGLQAAPARSTPAVLQRPARGAPTSRSSITAGASCSPARHLPAAPGRARTRGARPHVDLGARPPGRAWYRREGRPVTIVMPTYGDPSTTLDAVGGCAARCDPARGRESWWSTTAASPRTRRGLRRVEGVELELAAENRGYAASVNRGLARAGRTTTWWCSTTMSSPTARWLESLQHAAYRRATPASSGRCCSTPTGASRRPARHRNLGAPRVVRPPLPLQAPRPRAGERARRPPWR